MSSRYQFALHWTLFLRASRPPAVAKLLRRLSASIGRDVTPYLTERYWKLPELHRVQATTPLEAERIELAIFETLMLGRRIGVTIGSPSEAGDGWWSASGSGTGKGRRILGIEEMWFELRNYDYPGEPNVTGRPMPRYNTRDIVRITAPSPEHAALLDREGVISNGITIGPDGWRCTVQLYGESTARCIGEIELSAAGRAHPDEPEPGGILIDPARTDLESGPTDGC